MAIGRITSNPLVEKSRLATRDPTPVLPIGVRVLLLKQDAHAQLKHGTKWDDKAHVRTRARHTLPAIIGFTVGCSLGALLEATIGPWSLALPIGLALLALVLGFSVNPRI
jgi:uncharacterized membrane protein YoaK (UPF0700 family)